MNISVVLIAYVIMFVVGCIIGMIISFKAPIVDNKRSVLTTEEYNRYLLQSKQSAAVVHCGSKLCPDKTIMELINDGAAGSNLKFPDLSDL